MTRFLIELRFGEKYRKLKLYSAFFLYFLVLSLGSIPGARQEVGQIAPGLLLHSLVYSVITLLLFISYVSRPFRNAIQALLTVAAMGAIDEFIQSFLPYRTGAVLDWMVDVIASFITVSLLVAASKKRPQKAVRH